MSHIPGEVELRSLLINDYATTDSLSYDNLKCCLKFPTILDLVYQTYNLRRNLLLHLIQSVDVMLKRK